MTACWALSLTVGIISFVFLILYSAVFFLECDDGGVLEGIYFHTLALGPIQKC
jgi:hypothetical protein